MNGMAYSLNTEAAKRAENFGGRITETGKYKGEFARAEAVKSTRGSLGIEFEFRSGGASADFVTIWTHNAEGKELSGNDVLMAIMTCMRLRSITPTPGMIEKYDPKAGKRVRAQATLYPELMGKPIGLLLQREPYTKSDGSAGESMVIFAPFDANSELTASEIIDRISVPEKLARMVSVLRDRPMRKPASSTGAPATSSGYGGSQGGNYAGVRGGSALADMDDDIPF